MQDQLGREMHFRIERKAPLREVVLGYCRRVGLDTCSVAFILDGSRILGLETADDVGLDDLDIIGVPLHLIQ